MMGLQPAILRFYQLQLIIEIEAIHKIRTASVAFVIVFLNYQLAAANISAQKEIEVQAMAQTLAGECYDDKELDKHRVCEVIVNRVSSNKFANTVLEVVETPGAFNGYWKQSRPVSENDYAVAEQILKDWYDGGCKPLSKWLFFSKGSNRENVFRSEF